MLLPDDLNPTMLKILTDLLPENVMWGDNLTAEMLFKILHKYDAITSKPQKQGRKND
jgi:hypothetical protein